MLIEIGEKLHVVYRALYENSTRQHFLGMVKAIENSVVRLEGYVFVFEVKKDEFLRKEEKRTTFINIGECGCIVNLVPDSVDLDKVFYKYIAPSGLIVSDGKSFKLDISEFSFKT
ncbi:MAG: hypothetical protein HKO58_05000 [Gammaproteobacteria bacterium]|nr:hypothetical protein [Gammaproteobacteria bacterium]